MHLKTRNVNTAFRELVTIFRDGPVARESSRNGPVLRVDEPVTITYTHPTERVLFNPIRDCNPWFHLYEALWMLAGRNDVAPLAYYNSRMAEFSDDGKTLNGSYGYRWRHATSDRNSPFEKEHDQLDLLVEHLRADPNSRRAVLQMWNVEDDLLKIGRAGPSLGRSYDNGSKDVCCNLSVMFSLRQLREGRSDMELDMTVTNRSNDLVWGLLGANYVHFSVLQEYMAARLGAEVGRYHHFTNNLHAYVDRPDWKPDEWLKSDPEWVGPNYRVLRSVPLVRDPEAFDRELPAFVEYHRDGEAGLRPEGAWPEWSEPFLATVADPMLQAFHSYKRRAATTSAWVSRVASDDWRAAAREWIERRLSKKGKADVKG